MWQLICVLLVFRDHLSPFFQVEVPRKFPPKTLFESDPGKGTYWKGGSGPLSRNPNSSLWSKHYNLRRRWDLNSPTTTGPGGETSSPWYTREVEGNWDLQDRSPVSFTRPGPLLVVPGSSLFPTSVLFLVPYFTCACPSTVGKMDSCHDWFGCLIGTQVNGPVKRWPLLNHGFTEFDLLSTHPPPPLHPHVTGCTHMYTTLPHMDTVWDLVGIRRRVYPEIRPL